MLIGCRTPEGRLAAILPLELTSVRGVRFLRFLGHGPSDQTGPICAPADLPLASYALRRVLHRPPRRFHVFLGHQLPGPDSWGALLDARVVRRIANPVLPFRGETWEEVLGSFRSGIRREIRYDARRLAREHEVRHRSCDEPGSLESGLDVLFRLHSARWGHESLFVKREAFHRDFARLALGRGWLRLWVLEADGQPVAAKHNFRFCGAELSYQAGREPLWKGPSLGLVIVAHAMQAAFEDGVTEYRLLSGPEKYKFRFPVVDAGLETVVRGHGALARAAVAAAVAAGERPSLRRAPLAMARRVAW
jgi:CelD/BcsL family acetyltransferase involved in cellulose biosynthesis